MSVRLAIDTATATASVALGNEGGVLTETTVAPRQGAGGLLPAIEACLSRVGTDLTSVQEILLADGPGSFTGLRVGFGTVAGLVAARSLPVRTVPRVPEVL